MDSFEVVMRLIDVVSILLRGLLMCLSRIRPLTADPLVADQADPRAAPPSTAVAQPIFIVSIDSSASDACFARLPTAQATSAHPPPHP